MHYHADKWDWWLQSPIFERQVLPHTVNGNWLVVLGLSLLACPPLDFSVWYMFGLRFFYSMMAIFVFFFFSILASHICFTVTWLNLIFLEGSVELILVSFSLSTLCSFFSSQSSEYRICFGNLRLENISH